MSDWIPIVAALLALAFSIAAERRSRYWADQSEAAAKRAVAARDRALAAAGWAEAASMSPEELARRVQAIRDKHS